jgi:hypothetical protein
MEYRVLRFLGLASLVLGPAIGVITGFEILTNAQVPNSLAWLSLGYIISGVVTWAFFGTLASIAENLSDIAGNLQRGPAIPQMTTPSATTTSELYDDEAYWAAKRNK